MTRGALCISIDVELAWGIANEPSPAYHRNCASKERRIVSSLLRTFERYEMPVTWAIVGRLLERGPVPTADQHGELIWYAPDIVEAISRAKPRHDIGSHSYAHIYYGKAGRSLVEADLASARRVHDAHGLDFASFVFPRNSIDHLDLLRDHAVKVYRSSDQGWFITVRDTAGRIPGRVANLVDKLVPFPPTAVQPSRHDGLVELPSSMLLLARNGLRKLVRGRVVIEKARRGLEAARRNGGTFHLWFHPSNFYQDTEHQLALVAEIARMAHELRRRDQLDVLPMSAYAA